MGGILHGWRSLNVWEIPRKVRFWYSVPYHWAFKHSARGQADHLLQAVLLFYYTRQFP